MTSRNVDDSGDILPVTSPGDLASGSDAAAIGLADHLRMFTGNGGSTRIGGTGFLI